MSHGTNDSRKYGSNGTGPGRNVQVSGPVGATIWQQGLGGDRGDSQGPDGVPPLFGATDHRDDGEKKGSQRGVLPDPDGIFISILTC